MTTFLDPLEHFLSESTLAWSSARELGQATRTVAVFRAENYRLARVCSLAELRVAVATASMAMAAYALEMRQAVDSTAVLGLSSELADLNTLCHAIAQGETPRLIEGCLELRNAGELSRYSRKEQFWPADTIKLAGYQGGVEGLNRLIRACWTERLQWFDTSEHGISSVLPRTKAAFKHLRAHGLPVAHEKAILAILEPLQQTQLLQFLDETAL
jgi:hypothetical protein